MQLQEVRQYCTRREMTIVREYVDKGISAAKERRPALDQLLVDCQRRAVDCVVVYRYDRFARSLRQLVNALVFGQFDVRYRVQPDLAKVAPLR
jgi:DNA invertase Pin-like site-specific DNA recombinase